MSSPLEFAVTGGTIRALAHDTGGDRCVLALHGWLDNAASFTRWRRCSTTPAWWPWTSPATVTPTTGRRVRATISSIT
ncbi:MAG: hypothetical protein M5U09_24010 [Gammaproteobacteria bacterium]|nr:hypothetical protein [Gammaproteobacteria bacterium]